MNSCTAAICDRIMCSLNASCGPLHIVTSLAKERLTPPKKGPSSFKEMNFQKM